MGNVEVNLTSSFGLGCTRHHLISHLVSFNFGVVVLVLHIYSALVYIYNCHFSINIKAYTLMGGSMKVHQFARGLISWDQQHEPSLTLGLCKRLRPLIPKNPTTNSDTNNNTVTITNTTTSTTDIPFDLKSFIKPDCGPRKPDVSSSDDKRDQLTQVIIIFPSFYFILYTYCMS